MTDADELAGYVRAAFGLDGAPVSLTPAGRGALGQVFRLDIGPDRYAVKVLAEPVPDAVMAAEAAFTARASAAGIRVPTCYPAAGGRYAVPAMTGPGWIRLYGWLDAVPLDRGDADLPARLGTLLGRLHLCAPACAAEPGGSPPDPWFEVPPAPHVWPALADRARAADVAWAADLAARIPLIGTLTSLTVPPDPAAAILCHRDLHPENVLAGADGVLAVVDWDNLGPADPGRELARVLLDWFFDDGALAAEAAGAALGAYHATGAPGRLAGHDGVFGLAIASRLNFLRRQIGIALDGGTAAGDRVWATSEIEEALRILPSTAAFAELSAIDAVLPR